MKKLLFLGIACLFLFGLSAQEGIEFAQGEWQAALDRAKQEDKLIFMDAYATWCGPCKVMAREVFTDKEVGDYYNTNFINVKMDMEKGEGLKLAKAYNVHAYPSLLYLNGEGEIVHRAAGSLGAAEFIQLGTTALDPKNNLSGLNQRYEAGENNPGFLRELAMARYQAMDESFTEIAEAYINSQEDLSSPDDLSFIFTFTENIHSPMFDLLVKYREEIEAIYGAENVASRIQQLVTQELYAGPNDESALEEADLLFKKAYPEQAPRLSANFKMNYYNFLGDMDQYAKTAVAYFNQYPSNDANELNNVAWTFYESVDDPDMLKEALGWAKRSVALEENYYNNDTLAWIYFKLGEKRKAKKTAKKAIKIAQVLGEDYSSTQELLNQL